MVVGRLQSVDNCSLFSPCSQHDPLSLPPTRATKKQRTNKLGRFYQPERRFFRLACYSLPRRTATFTYMCLSAEGDGKPSCTLVGGLMVPKFKSSVRHPIRLNYRTHTNSNIPIEILTNSGSIQRLLFFRHLCPRIIHQ